MTRDDDALAARRRLMAQVHMGAARLFGADDREAYEGYLEARTGKRSCKALSDRELAGVARDLRQAGALDSRTRGGKGAERPTPAQWAKLGALARAMGWGGLSSPALQAFVQRTAKVSNSRFLTRAQASRVITGLEAWLRQQAGNEERETGSGERGERGAGCGERGASKENTSLLAPRSSLPDPGSSLLAPRSSLPDPGSSLLAPRPPMPAPIATP